MKRIAYHGLSSPIFYDFKAKIKKAKSDEWSSPNPILDSAFGTMLLFDEMWFFCESLCPYNLRGLPYVKYLEDIIDPIIFNNIKLESIKNSFGTPEELQVRSNRVRSNFDIYSQVMKNVGVTWDAAADNHTHGLIVAGKHYSGNSMTSDNLLFDIAIVEILRAFFIEYDIQLITNSFTQSWFDDPDSSLAKSRLTELLVIEHIPNYLTQNGPYHNCIEEVRANNYLTGYRRWISEKQLSCDLNELKDIKAEVENALIQAQREVFLKYLDPQSTYQSIGKTIIGAIADNVIPYLSATDALIEDLKDRKQKKNLMWQGFIISAKGMIK
jgi:hypothetical protein